MKTKKILKKFKILLLPLVLTLPLTMAVVSSCSSTSSAKQELPSNPSNPNVSNPIPPTTTPPSQDNSANDEQVNNDILLKVDPSIIPMDGTIPSNNVDNSDIKKWGNAPLEKKQDSLINENDLKEMFTTITNKKMETTITFGERKVDARMMSKAFSNWMLSYYKYYTFFAPYVLQFVIKDENGVVYNKPIPDNDEYINNKKLYIHSIRTTKNAALNFTSIWLKQGKAKAYYAQFISNFLNLIKQDMTDAEKTWVAYYYVSNFLRYDYVYHESISYTIFNKAGVCSDYSQLMTILLNIVDVPCLPVITNYHVNGIEEHEIIWVYIDIGLGDEKKWYWCDATWALGNAKISFKKQTSFKPRQTPKYFLKSFSSNQFQRPQNSALDMQYNSNLLFYSPWTEPFKNNELSLNPPKTLVETFSNEIYSNPVYYKGYWYFLYKNYLNLTQLVRTKFVNPQIEVVLDHDQLTKNGFNINIDDWNDFRSANNCSLNSFGWNDSIVIAKNTLNKTHFMIINLENKQYQKIESISHEKSDVNHFNFYIENGEIFYTNLNPYSEPDYIKLELNQNQKELLASNNDLKSTLYKNVVKYQTLASTFLVGNDPVNEVSEASKKDFLKYCHDLIQKINQNLSLNYQQEINDLEQRYNQYVPKLQEHKLFTSNKMDNLYEINKDYIDSIGYLPLNKIIVYDELIDLLKGNPNNVGFNVYFSKDNKDFKLVKSDVYLSLEMLKVTLKDLKQQSFDGFYYIEYYQYNFENVKYQTNVFEINVTNANTIPQLEGIKSQTNYNTNYKYFIENWWDNRIVLNATINPASVPTNNKISLKYINYDTKEIKILDTKDLFVDRNSVKLKWVIDKPNKNNHGIFWMELTNLDKNKKVYTNYFYHLTQEDANNFNDNQWYELCRLIKAN